MQEDNSIPSTSKGGITINQPQVEDDMEVCIEQHVNSYWGTKSRDISLLLQLPPLNLGYFAQLLFL